MNKCRKCQNLFEATENQIKKSDFLCPSCSKEYHKAYRAKRKADGNPVISGKMNRAYHRIYEAEYFKIESNKERRNANAKKYRDDPAKRVKNLARWLVARAINSGKLIKQPCEICGKIKVDAHHDDYSKPLDVRWLCRYHHNEHHSKAKGD